MEDKINGKNPPLESKSIDDYVYFNDEWNQPLSTMIRDINKFKLIKL